MPIVIKAVALGADAVYWNRRLCGTGCHLCQKCYTGNAIGNRHSRPLFTKRLESVDRKKTFGESDESLGIRNQRNAGGYGVNSIQSLEEIKNISGRWS